MPPATPRRRSSPVAGIALLVAFAACSGPPDTRDVAARAAASPSVRSDMLVIAHRGASGHRPEHTLEAYALGVAQGADFIEPDLVSTKDGVLIARHENEIGETTDVATKFPERKTTRVIDGVPVEGWFSEDFTWDEIRSLRAKERLSFRSHTYDGQFRIPRFEDVLALADSLGEARGRPVGVYPETKHPTYFADLGLALEPPLLRALREAGLETREAPVFIQSFEVGNLQQLRTQTPVRLVQLMAAGGAPYDLARAGDARTYADLATATGLRDVATWADAIGVQSSMVVPRAAGAAPTSLVADAHAAGLRVHVWTLRPEPQFLAPRYAGDPTAEVHELRDLGVDGVFGDYPDLVVKALGRTAH